MTTAQKTELLRYECTLGLSTMEGRGFYYPTDTVIGDNGRLYVVNRSLESVGPRRARYDVRHGQPILRYIRLLW